MTGMGTSSRTESRAAPPRRHQSAQRTDGFHHGRDLRRRCHRRWSWHCRWAHAAFVLSIVLFSFGLIAAAAIC